MKKKTIKMKSVKIPLLFVFKTKKTR